MEELIKYAREFVQEHPEHKEEVIEIIDLCRSEISEGELEENEVEHAYQAIKDLLI